MGGKGIGEIGGEVGEVTGVVADAPTMDGLGKRYGTFSGWAMAAGKVEVLLVVGGFDVDRCGSQTCQQRCQYPGRSHGKGRWSR